LLSNAIMSSWIPPQVLDEIETLKKNKNFDEAIRLVNSLLSRDPNNEDALLQIADIQYQKGDIGKADKAVDFLNAKKKDDPLALYIKGILEMEKNNREEALKILKRALDLTNGDNHEILRCYGLCEYRYGHREKGIQHLEKSFAMNDKDAEVIYNLIQLHMLESHYNDAEKMIDYYLSHHDQLIVVDKDLNWYDRKISLFVKAIETKPQKKRKNVH